MVKKLNKAVSGDFLEEALVYKEVDVGMMAQSPS